MKSLGVEALLLAARRDEKPMRFGVDGASPRGFLGHAISTPGDCRLLNDGRKRLSTVSCVDVWTGWAPFVLIPDISTCGGVLALVPPFTGKMKEAT